MQLKKNLLTATLLAIGSLTTVSAMAAGTANGEFKVKIKIDSACNVNAAVGAQDIDFGSVTAGAAGPANKTSATALSVQCSKGAAYVIKLTPSNANASGAGIMIHTSTPSDTIAYQLNSETASAKAWGDTGVLGDSLGNSVGGIGTGMSKTISHAVYATVTGSTDVAVGDYTDTVQVKVTY